jgi:hypothetical protein
MTPGVRRLSGWPTPSSIRHRGSLLDYGSDDGPLLVLTTLELSSRRPRRPETMMPEAMTTGTTA